MGQDGLGHSFQARQLSSVVPRTILHHCWTATGSVRAIIRTARTKASSLLLAKHIGAPNRDLRLDLRLDSNDKFIPAAQLPKTGFQLEHLREVNMMDSFVRSLLSGKLFSGVDMKNKLDPMAVYHGWSGVYDVRLPSIGLAVRDAADYTLPVTPNDRIYETIGSYAYREGVTFLPGPLNLLKRTLMRA